MTALSELFVDETLRDYIKRRWPNYHFDSIAIPRVWMGIWREIEFPAYIKTTLYSEDESGESIPVAEFACSVLVITSNMHNDEVDIHIKNAKLRRTDEHGIPMPKVR